MDTPFHTCNAAGLIFPTRKDWGEYLKAHPNSGREIVFSANGFDWNINDCCLNYRQYVIIFQEPPNTSFKELTIKTAQRPDGTWVNGYDHNGLMTDISYGGGSPVSFNDKKSFPTEDDAIKDVLRYMLSKDLAPKFRSIIQTEYNKRRIVQLTLF